MTIPPSQIESFRPALRRQFEERAVAHARRCFPAHTARLSNDDLLGQLRRAVLRAPVYRLKTELQIIRLFDALLLLGPGFESDPVHRWAVRVLNNRSHSADQRSQYLQSRACQVNNVAVAEENRYARY